MATRVLTYGSRGERVARLQRLINSSGYRRSAHTLVVDGEFGPLTGAACQQTKYWLGYQKGRMAPTAGPALIAYLTGDRRCSDLMRERRARRMAKLREYIAATPLRHRILSAAQQDVGVIEGLNNAIKFNEWWTGGHNDGGAYCVRAGSYWAAKAGSAAVRRGVRWQNTDALLSDAMHGRNGVHLTDDPLPGHGFVIDFSGHSDPDHYGVHVCNAPAGMFRSLEANATLSSGRQGVGYHERPMRQCWFIVFEH